MKTNQLTPEQEAAFTSWLLHNGKVITEQTALNVFDEYLNEAGDIEILGFKYQQSQILKAVDPIKYRCEFTDWLDIMGMEDLITGRDLLIKRQDNEDELLQQWLAEVNNGL